MHEGGIRPATICPNPRCLDSRRVARQQGVEVSLGVDWNPTGSDTLFDELRVAAQANTETFGGAIPATDWIPMVTTRPAKALALEDHLGRLAVGLKADLTVMQAKAPDPPASLLQSHLQDVLLVWVGGNLLYGAQAVLDQVKPGQCESLLVYCSPKRVCVKSPQGGCPRAGRRSPRSSMRSSRSTPPWLP